MKTLIKKVEPSVVFQPFQIILQFDTFEEAQLFRTELNLAVPKQQLPHLKTIAHVFDERNTEKGLSNEDKL